MPSWFSSLRAIVDPFIQICLLRRGPQDLPTSGILLAIALAAHTLMAVLFFAVYENAMKALLSGALDTVLLAALTGTLLYVQRQNARFVQTLTALAGTGALFTLISLPVSGWFLGAGPESREGGIAIMLLLTLVAWSLAVAGHIFRHALSAPYFVGLVFAVVFYGISIWVFRALFPPSA
jgi:hypothetical protein